MIHITVTRGGDKRMRTNKTQPWARKLVEHWGENGQGPIY